MFPHLWDQIIVSPLIKAISATSLSSDFLHYLNKLEKSAPLELTDVISALEKCDLEYSEAHPLTRFSNIYILPGEKRISFLHRCERAFDAIPKPDVPSDVTADESKRFREIQYCFLKNGGFSTNEQIKLGPYNNLEDLGLALYRSNIFGQSNIIMPICGTYTHPPDGAEAFRPPPHMRIPAPPNSIRAVIGAENDPTEAMCSTCRLIRKHPSNVCIYQSYCSRHGENTHTDKKCPIHNKYPNIIDIKSY